MKRDALTPEKLREAYQHVWFVVARSQDIDTPQSATLLDHNLVVFRDSTGAARVTDRRCIHRGGNLADGKVVGTALPARTTAGSSTVPADSAAVSRHWQRDNGFRRRRR